MTEQDVKILLKRYGRWDLPQGLEQKVGRVLDSLGEEDRILLEYRFVHRYRNWRCRRRHKLYITQSTVYRHLHDALDNFVIAWAKSSEAIYKQVEMEENK